jgi:hypothetical protein
MLDAPTKNPRLLRERGFFAESLVPLAGIELATFSLRMNCSTN